jgi:riboflavin biosynthesis pyrimidine reductase
MAIRRLFPEDATGGTEPLTDDELTGLYAHQHGVRMNFVSSVDGAVEVDGRSAGLGTPADRKVFGLLRQFPDALLVGAGTVRREGYHAVTLDPPRRAWRREHGLAPYPRLVVVTARLDLDPSHPAFADAPVRPIVLTRSAAPPDRRTAMEPVADVLCHGDDEVDLAAGLADLRERGLTRILCEGGPHLFGALTAADLVDEVCLTISPMLAGAGAGRITAGPASAVRGLTLAHVLCADSDLLMRYARSR